MYLQFTNHCIINLYILKSMYTVSGIAQTPGPPLPDDRNLLNVSKAGQNRSRPDCYWDEGQNDMTPKKSIWVIYIYIHT